MSPDETFIFPLNTVLFPGGTLPLKIFEQRYLEMTKTCIRENRPFGVCLIREGKEVGTPAVPCETGCLARITQWDMPQLGMFQLLTEGTQRFRIVRCEARKDGLITAQITLLPQDPEIEPRETLCAEVLKSVIEKVGSEHFPSPHRFHDAAWIGYRLGEVLPISLGAKQQLLELDDPQERLAKLGELFERDQAKPA